jgi:hypothetical protein
LQIVDQHTVVLLPLFGNDLLRHGLKAGVVATLVVAEQLFEQITITSFACQWVQEKKSYMINKYLRSVCLSTT